MKPHSHILNALRLSLACCHAYTQKKHPVKAAESVLHLLKHQNVLTYMTELLQLGIFSVVDLDLLDLCLSLAMFFSLDLFSFFNLSFFFVFSWGSCVSLFSWSLTALN